MMSLWMLSLAIGVTPPFWVWTGERPTGKTWAKLGDNGSIVVAPSVDEPKRTVLRITMTGNGFRGCGLNWRGWYPEDGGDDIRKYVCVTFRIRQVTRTDDADLLIGLTDSVKRADGTHASQRLSIRGEGGIDRIDGQWRQVIIPIERLARNKPLTREKVWGIDFIHQGEGKLVFEIDQIGFSNDQQRVQPYPELPGYNARVVIDPNKEVHPISEGIYGVAQMSEANLKRYGITSTRWGGNTSSRYNWKLNADNGANDWYFKNRGTPLMPRDDSMLTQMIRDNEKRNGSVYLTMPMLGWVAKDFAGYGFSLRKYGPQKATEPGNPDVGNGIRPNGSFVRDNDPRDTSIPAPPEFIAEGITRINEALGKSTAERPRYYVLDNEPMLWHSTHRDVSPRPLTYDGLWERTVRYGEAIKKSDPGSQVAGFCSWGWTDLFYSAADENGDGYKTQPDHVAHGRVPLAEWYLQQCGRYQRIHNNALVDLFDVHWYPQSEVNGQGVYLGRGRNQELAELRLRSTRELWDMKYRPESWIREAGQGQAVQLLPRIRKWRDQHAPGMKLVLGEYNFGGSDNISGALAQAEVFGILARQAIDFAYLWATPEGTQELAWQLFRNYDDRGSRFGDRLLPATSDKGALTVHAARRSSDKALTIVLINQDLQRPCTATLDLGDIQGRITLHRFDQKSIDRVSTIDAAEKVPQKLIFPPASATILVVVQNP